MSGDPDPHPLAVRSTELVWEGKYDARGQRRQPDAASLRVPLHHREILPGEGGPNLLIHGENLRVLASLLPEYRGRVDLVYIDPPFGVGASFSQRGESGARLPAYRDFLGRGADCALHAFYERLLLAHALLRDGGSAYIHMDYRLHPYFRLIAGEIFGPRHLVNDIVWHYRSGGGTRRRFGMKHDNLLLFAKGPGYTFNPDAVRTPYDAVIARKRRASFHPAGKVTPDVWDISRPPNHSREWTGYATQKPLALLERILLASSNPGDLVLDYYGGSGTTAVAAQRLGRRWILCDESPAAIQTTRKRLLRESPPVSAHLHTAGDTPPPGPPSILPRLHVAAPAGKFHISLDIGEPDREKAPVDFWAVDLGAGDGGPFRHDWWAARSGNAPPVEQSPPFPVQEGQPPRARVLVVDVHGRECIHPLGPEARAGA